MAAPTVDVSQAKILRPELRFEALFEGRAAVDVGSRASTPIPFFEWADRKPPDPFDPFAGKQGYSPDLIRYLPCSPGQLVLLYIPLVAGTDGKVRRYRYRVSWRLQSLARYQDESLGGVGAPYHVPYEAPGAPDSRTAPPQRRNIMPAAQETTAISFIPGPTAYPPAVSFNAQTFYGGDSIVIDTGQTGRPVVRGSRPVAVLGDYQQGIVDPAVITSDYPFLPVFAAVELVCKGDQMLIYADRLGLDPEEPSEWQFTDYDLGFSQLYGTDLLGTPHPPFPDVGIYVMFEATPRAPSVRRSGPVPEPAPP